MKIRRIDFSPDEWLGGTVVLNNAERGLYITACALIYAAGGAITKEHLRAACGNDHGHAFNHQFARLVALRKLDVNDGQITNKRAINELQKAEERSINAQQNASKRWKNNDLESKTALQGRNANHQPSTTNHQLTNPSYSPSASRAASPRNGAARYASGNGTPLAGAPEPWPQRIAAFKKSGFWIETDWGPHPGQPGCQVPVEFLEAK